MEQNRNEPVSGMSDHEKFGESSSFAGASADASSTPDTPDAQRAPQVYDRIEESAASGMSMPARTPVVR